jgi:hypothetical protein
MKNTKIKDKAEFEARQMCLGFGDVCRAVLSIVVDVKESLGAWANGFLRNFRMQRPEVKKPEQLRLNLMPWLEAALIAC